MSEYRRPSIPAEIYSDEQGRPVEYGNRWDGASPPADAYSRFSNLQRFAPLHAVASALIEWLQDTFDVTIDQSPRAATDLLRMPDDVVSAIRVVPRDPSAATLTFHRQGCGCPGDCYRKASRTVSANLPSSLFR